MQVIKINSLFPEAEKHLNKMLENGYEWNSYKHENTKLLRTKTEYRKHDFEINGELLTVQVGINVDETRFIDFILGFNTRYCKRLEWNDISPELLERITLMFI